MALKHIRRDVPPWARISGYTMCGRRVAGKVTAVSREEWEAELKAAAATTRIDRWDRTFGEFCKARGTCQTCGSASFTFTSWDRGPFSCLGAFAHFANGHKDTGVTSRALAELFALIELVDTDRDRYEAMVQRHEALMALAESRLP